MPFDAAGSDAIIREMLKQETKQSTTMTKREVRVSEKLKLSQYGSYQELAAKGLRRGIVGC
jgi:hypothetical protein